MKIKHVPMVVRNSYRTSGHCLIYECKDAEEYTHMRNREICDEVASVGIAFVIVMAFVFLFMAILH